jgi:cell shape-determining protein MreC
MRRNESRWQLLYPALLIAALVLFLVPESQVAALRGRALSALSPILELFTVEHPAIQPTTASIPVGGGQAAENPVASAEMAAELDKARIELIRVMSELNALKAANPQAQVSTELPSGITARVIARKILRQDALLGLKAGEAEGVHMHAGVLHRGAVVGRIVSVGPHASSMAQLTHPGMSIGARLSECRVEGVLQGAKAEETERLCRLMIVGRELAAKPGEHVVTSGLDGIFPPGLWLGDVVEIKKSGDFQWEVTVRPACNENMIESVFVMTGKLPEVPWPASATKKKN